MLTPKTRRVLAGVCRIILAILIATLIPPTLYYVFGVSLKTVRTIEPLLVLAILMISTFIEVYKGTFNDVTIP